MPILYLERHQATVVMPGKDASQNLRAHINDLPSLLSQTVEKDLQGHWRILFADDLVYQDAIPLPPHVRDKELYISQQLSKGIPDKLEKHDWGFTTKRTNEGYEASVFAPVPAYWHRVRTVLETQKIPIEAIVTVSLAGGQSKDIFEGATKAAVDKSILQALLPQNASSVTTRRTLVIVAALGIVLIVAIILALRGVS